MKNARTIFLLVVSAAAFLSASPSIAQVLPRIASIQPDETAAGQPLTITVHFLPGQTYARAELAYRAYGESQFRITEMELSGASATTTLASRFILPPFLEYYLILTDRNGKVETHPFSEGVTPRISPPPRTLTIAVRSPDQEEQQILFLSPDPDDILDAADVVISVSLVRADTAVAPEATELALDGTDVTSATVISGDLIVFIPANAGITLAPGTHTVRVHLRDRSGRLTGSALRHFTVQGTPAFSYAVPAGKEFRYGGQLYMESRHEQIAGSGTWYNRLGYQFAGSLGEWRLSSNAFLTSDERSSRQPQNRFYIGVESPVFSAGYGDAYPLFPALILSGKRVRGVHGALRLGFFNVDLAAGTTTRAIEGTLLQSFPADSLAARQLEDPTSPYAPIDSATWGKYSYGTYERELFAVRPSFGSGETWQLGFTWLTSRDRRSSISYGIRPQENLVVGADLRTRFDAGRLELTAQGAFSASNTDVSSGTFSDAYIDSVYPNDADQIKKVRDILDRFITVNENLRPLSLKTLPSLALEAGLNANYFGNFLRGSYIYRGSDYTSFGQTYLRKDIQGFNLYDNIRLIGNQLLLTLGYERLQDNLSNTKAATTTFTTMNAALSYYPTLDLPSLTTGFTRFASRNGLSAASPLSPLMIDDNTDRFFVQSTYSLVHGGTHLLMANWSTSFRDDRSPRDYDVQNTYLSLGVNSRYAIPLQTFFDVSLNYNMIPEQSIPGAHGRLDYTAVTAGGRYGIIPDNVTLFATVTPTFGDVKRTVLDGGIEWYAMPTMLFTLEVSYFRNSGIPNDSFFSLRYRYDI